MNGEARLSLREVIEGLQAQPKGYAVSLSVAPYEKEGTHAVTIQIPFAEEKTCKQVLRGIIGKYLG